MQAAEDVWDTRDPERVALAFTADSIGRNRDTFLSGRAGVVRLLAGRWDRDLNDVLRKSLRGLRQNRMTVRFQYEWHDRDDQRFGRYGDELWEFDEHGLMRRREAGINDVRTEPADRRWFGGVRATSAARVTTSRRTRSATGRTSPMGGRADRTGSRAGSS